VPQALQQAFSFHQQGRLAEAEQIYREVLRTNPRDFDVLHMLGVLKLQQGKPADASGLLSQAVELKPASLDALANLTTAFLMLNRPEQALAVCDRSLAAAAGDASALFHRGIALMQLGRLDEALASYDRALAIKPDHVGVLFNRATTLAMLAQFDAALAAYDKVIALAPNNIEGRINRGNVLANLGRTAEALASFDKALALEPNHVVALGNRGAALRKLQRSDEALASLDRALAIAPDHADTLNNRGNALMDLHRPRDALADFDRALKINPAQPNVLTNRAAALHALERYQDALRSCEDALAGDPGSSNAFLMRGHILAKLDRPAEAATSYEQALAVDPAQPFAFGASVLCHLAACNWDKAASLTGAVREHVRDARSVVPPFNLLGLPIDASDQLQCARNFVRQRLPAEPEPLARGTGAETSGKIRLAYFSGDFRRHPITYLITELLERHDRTRFEVIGVSYGRDDGSEERTRIVRAFDQVHDVQERSDRGVAVLIRDLHAEIVIDLGGHTENSRLAALASRPAPIQVSYLGYAGTTGADFIDYVIGDKVVLPLDHQPYYSEKIVQLPDCYLVNDTKKSISPDVPSRAQAGLPEQGFVFCCFNNSYKITAEIFDVWMRLLKGIDGSVLWLSRMNDRATARLHDTASERGVDPARLVFAPKVPSMADHLARQRLADLFIDTLPYNAHTTASDALWAGVPVLTCPGKAFPGRVAASMLHAIGLPELVTKSLDEYEALARALAAEPARLRSLRQELEQHRLSRPLFDTDRFRRHIEAAYTRMWQMRQRGEAPRSFGVDAIEG